MVVFCFTSPHLNIPLAVSHLRSDNEIPATSRHFDGGQCRVFKVEFADGESWAIRLPLFVRAPRETIFQLLESETHILTELETTGFQWAAKLRSCDFTFDNVVGVSFIALTWIPGSVTATEHFTRIIRNKLNQVRNGQPQGITEQDCVSQMNILRDIILPELDSVPFAFDHGGLAPQNILIDAEYNVTRMIDWGFAAAVPIQQAACSPRLLRLQHLAPPSSVLCKDRERYIASLQLQTSQAMTYMALVQSLRDSDFHGMHRSLARNGWRVFAEASQAREK
ncbi:hypothetical protein BJY04DRAFT_210812 [Aspergillus karnatakaensis]|uniref:uncharacterized protein n=1 Tax=Aspergillus karnatakaensis TaxID=1810916 RepID=UPI003CCDE1FE